MKFDLDEQRTDDWFSLICTGRQLPAYAANELQDIGFVVIPGPVASEEMALFASAYDVVMNSGEGSDKKIGSATTRLYDFVNRAPEFDDFYTYQPILDACCQVIGAPFKLSSTLGRTLRPHSDAQDLHVDIESDSPDGPMVGFILMVDEFRMDNGATRFVPGSHRWPESPDDGIHDRRADYDRQVLACGSAGSIILFHGSIWHGHTANTSHDPRRSVQGYFVRREARSGLDHSARMQAKTLERLGPLARYILAI